jgi:hypothetical protein
VTTRNRKPERGTVRVVGRRGLAAGLVGLLLWFAGIWVLMDGLGKALTIGNP